MKEYNTASFRLDFFSALMVLIILVPQAMAYSLIAGVEPIYGLYAAFVPLLIYGLLGTSPHLSIGPVAISSLLLYSGLSGLADPFTSEYLSLAILVGLLVGIIQALFGFLRLGFLVNFLSLPVINGFVSAAAILIIISQLKHVFNINFTAESDAFSQLRAIVVNMDNIHWISFGFSVTTIIAMVLSRKFFKKFPMALVLIVIFAMITYKYSLNDAGVSVIGTLPGGLPKFEIPTFSWNMALQLWPTVLAVSFISIIESISIAKSLEQHQDKYEIGQDQELIAIGMAKVVGSFFQSYPSSGSFSRSSINSQMGAVSGLSSIILSILLGLVLLFFTESFEYIPYPVLAAIIIASVYRMIDFKEFSRLWQLRRRDWATMVITFLVTLLFGIQYGVLSGIILSFTLLLYKTSTPHYAELGRVGKSNKFRNHERFPSAHIDDRYIIFRLDEMLCFANALYVKDQMLDLIRNRITQPQYFIFDMSHVNEVDATGLQALVDISKQLDKMGIHLLISSAIGPVRDMFSRGRLMDIRPMEYHFSNIEHAIEYIETGKAEDNHLIGQHY